MGRAIEVARPLARHLIEAKDPLNELDAFAGDGDLGLTMATGCTAVLEALADLADAPPSEVLRCVGTLFATKAPSTSGTLVAFALIAAAKDAAGSEPDWDAASLARLLQVMATTIATRGKSSLGDKTIVDALAPAAEAASAAAAAGADLPAAAAQAAAAAAEGAARTAAMQPKHGRASWLSDRSAGHEDAGARAVAVALAGLAEAVAALSA